MSVYKRLSDVFASAEVIPFDNNSNIVLMSDCHRGDGNWNDNFSNNQNLFFAALNYYYERNFIYIELGDGDELWENRNMKQIINMHSDVFWLMSKFYYECRLYMIYGNHDIVKKNKQFTICKMDFYDEVKRKKSPLFPDIVIYEGLILQHKLTGDKIFLTHGHQGDFLNETVWGVARFLSRYLWRPLELIGFKDPTRAATNYTKKEKAENKFIKWSIQEKQILITGHTHRPVFPKPGEHLYFNDGSCIHPRCITAIEIKQGTISLVKWALDTKKDRTLFVGRQMLEGPELLKDYFKM
jgi:UDP-2,3-diacylglucosamine pyrophosphatase LpxH